SVVALGSPRDDPSRRGSVERSGKALSRGGRAREGRDPGERVRAALRRPPALEVRREESRSRVDTLMREEVWGRVASRAALPPLTKLLLQRARPDQWTARARCLCRYLCGLLDVRGL